MPASCSRSSSTDVEQRLEDRRRAGEDFVERVVDAAQREPVGRIELFRVNVEAGALPSGDRLGEVCCPLRHVAPRGLREEVERTVQSLAVESRAAPRAARVRS